MSGCAQLSPHKYTLSRCARLMPRFAQITSFCSDKHSQCLNTLCLASLDLALLRLAQCLAAQLSPHKRSLSCCTGLKPRFAQFTSLGSVEPAQCLHTQCLAALDLAPLRPAVSRCAQLSPHKGSLSRCARLKSRFAQITSLCSVITSSPMDLSKKEKAHSVRLCKTHIVPKFHAPTPSFRTTYCQKTANCGAPLHRARSLQ